MSRSLWLRMLRSGSDNDRRISRNDEVVSSCMIRKRRSTRVEVLHLEDRALLSGTPAFDLAHRFLTPVHSRVVDSSSFGPLSAPKVAAPAPTLTPIQRLGYYDPVTRRFKPLVNVPNYANLLHGKDVYVLVHGWAPGYTDWVKAYAQKYHKVLEWWQTIPSNYQGGTGNKMYQSIKSLDTSGAGPESPWLLNGYPTPVTRTSTIVSAGGLAHDLVATDPKAVVLAYSWLDDSATSNKTITIPVLGYNLSIPQDAYHSEALTTVNGARLAVALEQVLGPDARFGGKLQLIGHSHGSKVVTVAANLLTTASPANRLTVNQLTTLDSPESDSYGGSLLAEAGATNDNWYFMQDLNINQHPSKNAKTTFVDNYISALDEPYDVIAYTKQGVSYNLSQVIDTNLYAWPLLNHAKDLANVHSYAAYWYAGSSEKGVTYGHRVGRMWSPFVAGSAPPAQSYNEQAWHSYNWKATQQYSLTTPCSFCGPFTIAPSFTTVDFSPTVNTPGVNVANDPGAGSGASVTLTQQGSDTQSYQGTFTASAHYFSGITFNYKFNNFKQGDELNIYVKTSDASHPWDLAFRMDPIVIQPQAQPSSGSQLAPVKGTISLANSTLSTDWDHTLMFTLTSAQDNSTSSVTVSNLMQYSLPVLGGPSRTPLK